MIFLELQTGKSKIVINAADIVVMFPAKKKGTTIILDYDDLVYDVDDDLEQIIKSLAGLEMLRRPANIQS